MFKSVAPVDKDLGPVAVKDKQQRAACLGPFTLASYINLRSI